MVKLIELIGEERVKNIMKVSLVLLLFLLLGTFFAQSYAKYETNAKLSANIDKAIYLLKDEKLTFNIDPEAIIPSDTAYQYTFTVSNYNDTENGDINLKYYIQLKTTTNLPITLKLVRNEQYSASATNIANGYTLVQDEDNAWYKLYTKSPTYEFQYNVRRKDTYILVVEYPLVYKTYLQYAGVPENIEVAIYSEQKV
ncbi:MAG: hypothetical protein IKH54_00530 [Bacilli bacterium]|nr:hypothetical protein [Bacilli bacterium]